MNETESLMAIVNELDRAQRKFPGFPTDPLSDAIVEGNGRHAEGVCRCGKT